MCDRCSKDLKSDHVFKKLIRVAPENNTRTNEQPTLGY